MARFTLDHPKGSIRIEVVERFYDHPVTDEKLSRFRAQEEQTGFETGGTTEEEAFDNLAFLIFDQKKSVS